MTQQISEAELQAYVDGQLEPQRHAEVERWLAESPDHAECVAAYQRQNDALHALFDPVLDEPVPVRLQPAQRRHWFAAPLMRYAAAVAWVALGGMLGWALHGMQAQRPAPGLALAHQAALAHVVYTPEVRHPVEVGADQEAHLVTWLSKRLGSNVKVPHLGEAGYELMGGRLLPGSSGPAAQFMYQDARGQRLTLYVRTDASANAETAFRYARENNLGVFYWMDGPFGYALSGELGKAELLQVAQLVYRQLNP
ncbi:MAG TPA: anti-sigma factor [Gallionellaceae bacterium]|nr:anti-sigma factor [Gallionellaceae bacterium]